MKIKLLTTIILLNISLCVYSQIDRIDFHIIPIMKMYFAEELLTPDYVRINSDYHFSSTNKSFNNNFYEFYKNLNKEIADTSTFKDFTSCRIVIDFISGSEIRHSIILNQFFDYIIEVRLGKIPVYKKNAELIDFLEKWFYNFIYSI